jgi:hypothetical protein
MLLCVEQGIELCVIQLESKFFNIYVLAIYRAPIGDFEQFLSSRTRLYVIFINPKPNLSSVVI